MREWRRGISERGREGGKEGKEEGTEEGNVKRRGRIDTSK